MRRCLAVVGNASFLIFISLSDNFLFHSLTNWHPVYYFFHSENSFARQCWLVVLSIDNWKRGLLYLALSAACYVNLKQTWQVLLAGGLMDLCGLLYFIKTIKTKKQIDPYKYKQLSVTWSGKDQKLLVSVLTSVHSFHKRRIKLLHVLFFYLKN